MLTFGTISMSLSYIIILHAKNTCGQLLSRGNFLMVLYGITPLEFTNIENLMSSNKFSKS